MRRILSYLLIAWGTYIFILVSTALITKSPTAELSVISKVAWLFFWFYTIVDATFFWFKGNKHPNLAFSLVGGIFIPILAIATLVSIVEFLKKAGLTRHQKLMYSLVFVTANIFGGVLLTAVYNTQMPEVLKVILWILALTYFQGSLNVIRIDISYASDLQLSDWKEAIIVGSLAPLMQLLPPGKDLSRFNKPAGREGTK